MKDGYEIERKFLVKMPELSQLDIKRTLNIVQTYLKNGENGSQRRVRRITENGTVTRVFTEKIFLTPVTREEHERDISPSEYDRLLTEKRNDCVPIIKTRYCFAYNKQLFELDVYPFSDKLAILELELDSPDQKIDFPGYISVISDVTGIEGYSNAALANAGRFPDLPTDRQNGDN